MKPARRSNWPATAELRRLVPRKGPNYTEDSAGFALIARQAHGRRDRSAKRFYPVRQMPTTEAGIKTLGSASSMSRLATRTADGAHRGRVWWKPLVTLIWLGGIV